MTCPIWLASIHFRTATAEVDGWLRQLDRWIAYANSVVAE